MKCLELVFMLAAGGLFQTVPGQQASAVKEVWRDPATGLTWAGADNGAGASAAQAAYYCRSLKLGGRNDWRLPGIEELQSIFGGPADENGRHVTGPVRVTGWAWSATPGLQSGEQWALDFGDGGRASAVTGDSGLNRALCVRGQGQL